MAQRKKGFQVYLCKGAKLFRGPGPITLTEENLNLIRKELAAAGGTINKDKEQKEIVVCNQHTLSRYIRVTPYQLSQLRNNGVFHTYRLSGQVLYPVDEVISYLKDKYSNQGVPEETDTSISVEASPSYNKMLQTFYDEVLSRKKDEKTTEEDLSSDEDEGFDDDTDMKNLPRPIPKPSVPPVRIPIGAEKKEEELSSSKQESHRKEEENNQDARTVLDMVLLIMKSSKDLDEAIQKTECLGDIL